MPHQVMRHSNTLLANDSTSQAHPNPPDVEALTEDFLDQPDALDQFYRINLGRMNFLKPPVPGEEARFSDQGVHERASPSSTC
jgi:hypothetical protein